MYEDRDFDYCMNRLLEHVSGVSKEEGSLVYSAIAPVAYEMEQMYIELDEVINQTFADTADYDYLKRRAQERALYPVAATSAQVKARFNCEVPEGSSFGCGSYTYTSGDLLDSGEGYYDYRLTCLEEGTGPNGVLGELEDLDGIEDFETGTITEILVAGTDEEDVEAFRTRYLSSFSVNSFGGNVAQYMSQVKGVSGVGACHIYPVWNGGGTVKAEILNASYRAANATLIAAVQEVMCPTPSKGYGLAPIGHNLTVAAATEVTVNIETTLTFATGVSYSDVQSDVAAVLETYMAGLRRIWESEYVASEAALVVRIAAIESALLSITGIIDVEDTAINSTEANLSLTVHQIPILGTITVHDSSEEEG